MHAVTRTSSTSSTSSTSRTSRITRLPQRPVDRKNSIGYWFWNTVNWVITTSRFSKIEVSGTLPVEGPFILVANHSSRWDGPLIQRVLNRPANYMVSPNEIKGLQAAAVLSVGAFPANPRLDLVGFSEEQLKKGQPVVIFPEGNVFYDKQLHPFKQGTAKIALAAAVNGVPVPIIPVYISYQNGPDWENNIVQVVIGPAIDPVEYTDDFDDDNRSAVKKLTSRLQDEIYCLKERLTNHAGVLARRISATLSSAAKSCGS